MFFRHFTMLLAASFALAAEPVTARYDNLDLRILTPPAAGTAARAPAVFVTDLPGTEHVDPAVYQRIADAGFVVLQIAKVHAEIHPTMNFRTFFGAIAKDRPIDPERIFILGFSANGHTALTTALDEPLAFWGAIAVCHHADPPAKVDARNQHLAFLVISGSQDPNYGAIKAISKLWSGRKLDLTFKDIPGLGHLFRTDEVPVIVNWMQAKLNSKDGLNQARARSLAAQRKASGSLIP